MNLWLRGGKNNYALWEGHVHTATFNMDNQQRPIYSTWNSAQLFVAAWMKESLGERDAWFVCVPLSFTSNYHSAGDWLWCCCLVTQWCPTLCGHMNCSTPGCPVFHCLPEFAQTHVHWLDDAIQPEGCSVAPFSSCPQYFSISGSIPQYKIKT